jgi:4-hydroxybenzoate polyprenyltransferase
VLLGQITLRLRLWRLYQWSKNLLVYLPLIASHKLGLSKEFQETTVAFISFCFAATSGYLVNDLLDKQRDLLHPIKQKRPIPSGLISNLEAKVWILVFTSVAVWSSLTISTLFFASILSYLFLTFTYSLVFKKLVMVDILSLSLLYLIRILGGSIASQTEVSVWLIVFTGFLFLSLGAAKRYSELIRFTNDEYFDKNGRGYKPSDASVVQTFGIVPCFAATVILSIYVTDDATQQLYEYPPLLLLTIPIFLTWTMKLWIQIHRGVIIEDPIVYLLRNRETWISVVLILAVATVSSISI